MDVSVLPVFCKRKFEKLLVVLAVPECPPAKNLTGRQFNFFSLFCDLPSHGSTLHDHLFSFSFFKNEFIYLLIPFNGNFIYSE